MSLDCRCVGMYPFSDSPCENPATEEDGLCDRCREQDCARVREECRGHLMERANDDPKLAAIIERRMR